MNYLDALFLHIMMTKLSLDNLTDAEAEAFSRAARQVNQVFRSQLSWLKTEKAARYALKPEAWKIRESAN